MQVSIVSGAPQPWLDRLKLQETFIIGVDRGALVLLNQGITPHLAIGDFDSVTASEFNQIKNSTCELIQLSCEKDETDTEVAIAEAMKRNATSIHVYGALGGRIDHTLANIRLLLKWAIKGIRVTLIDEKNELTVLSPGSYCFKTSNKKYLSFFALNQTVSHLSLSNVKYPLEDYYLHQDDVRCISNEITHEEFYVSFEEGYLLMIYSND